MVLKDLSERIESNPDESLKNELAELEMALNRLAPYLPAFTVGSHRTVLLWNQFISYIFLENGFT